MLEITPKAIEILRKRNEPIFLELPRRVTGCCLQIQECPMVRFGRPREHSRYEERSIDGQSVWVPMGFPDDLRLTLTVSVFLGFKRLVLEGWRLI
ncbi:MAG: CC/Se motif family (seleno)protein [Holophaga sp.]|jgi:hypothetical protein